MWDAPVRIFNAPPFLDMDLEVRKVQAISGYYGMEPSENCFLQIGTSRSVGSLIRTSVHFRTNDTGRAVCKGMLT